MKKTLEQMRKGIVSIIDFDRGIGTITRYVKKDNGRGSPVPTEETTEHKLICRVSTQSVTVWGTKSWEGGLSIDKTPFILARFDADIEQGDTLEWRGRNYTVGVVSRPEIGGGFVCTQAPLTEVKSGG